MGNSILTTEEASKIAVSIAEKNKEMTANEQAFFVAGFQECLKHINLEQLIEDYERRLTTAETMLKEKDYSNTSQAERLKTKASCYRTFLAEIKNSNLFK